MTLRNARAKGNAFERDVAARLLPVDGVDPVASKLAPHEHGRVGHLDLGPDVVSRRFQVQAKAREDHPIRLWTWLLEMAGRSAWPNHVRILWIKRNHREPLVVMRESDFLHLIEEHADAD